MSSHLSTKVSLFLQALKLKNKDLLSKNDPFVVVSLQGKGNNNKPGPWEEIYRTSTIDNNNDPQWADPVTMEYRFEEVQYLKFDVYDRDAKSEKLSKHDFIGTLETTMSQIMGSRGCTFSSDLSNKKGKKTAKLGKLIIVGQEVNQLKDEIQLRFRATNLKRKNMMGLGRSDPFYVISLENSDGKFIKVFESEYIKSTTKPVWKRQNLPVQVLTNGDYDATLKFAVFDWESSGKHKFIGSFVSSLSEMKEKREFTLVDTSSKKSNSGKFIVDEYRVTEKSSFLEYIQGGCEMRLSVAIDFTASNLPPHKKESLHYMEPEFHFSGDRSQVNHLNEYQRAILAIGEILQDYDSDGMIPAFGFGASGPEKYGLNKHCFPLLMSKDNVEVKKIPGIMQAYRTALSTVALSGPTYFADVVKRCIEDAEPVTQENQSYNILLILTDGIINDMNETIKAIIDASELPISIIIVGVGSANFNSMEVLDCDEPGKFLTHNRKTAARDIVQFVPFRKFEKMSYTALAEETLREIPDQMEEFFRKKGIKPNPKKEASARHFEVAEAEAVTTDNKDVAVPVAVPEKW